MTFKEDLRRQTQADLRAEAAEYARTLAELLAAGSRFVNAAKVQGRALANTLERLEQEPEAYLRGGWAGLPDAEGSTPSDATTGALARKEGA